MSKNAHIKVLIFLAAFAIIGNLGQALFQHFYDEKAKYEVVQNAKALAEGDAMIKEFKKHDKPCQLDKECMNVMRGFAEAFAEVK